MVLSVIAALSAMAFSPGSGHLNAVALSQPLVQQQPVVVMMVRLLEA